MTTKILLVEDDESVRDAYANVLTYAGYDVCKAADGATALQLLKGDVFAVVITDIFLSSSTAEGQIDGIEVLRVARQQPYCPEVIILTGYGSLQTSIQALRAGAIDYLLKPASSVQLRAAVERALQRHQTWQQMRAAVRTIALAFDPQTNGMSAQQSPTEAQRPGVRKPPPTGMISVGALLVGPTRREVTLAGRAIHLTNIEHLLLRYLAYNTAQVCTAIDIVRFIHGRVSDENEARALVKPHIHNLRKKLPPECLMTERGVGYRLVVPDPEKDS